MSEGIRRITAERERQIYEEGYDPKHDKIRNNHSQLALAAATYAIPETRREGTHDDLWGVKVIVNHRHIFWPWVDAQWKPEPESGPDPYERLRGRLRNLTKAGALIAAEIDRLAPLEQKALDKKQEQGEG